MTLTVQNETLFVYLVEIFEPGIAHLHIRLDTLIKLYWISKPGKELSDGYWSIVGDLNGRVATIYLVESMYPEVEKSVREAARDEEEEEVP